MQERAKWKKFGKPTRSEEEIGLLFDICAACPHFQKQSETTGDCGICGCHLKKTGTFLNKLAWGTTRCPLPENPKWVEKEKRFAKEVTVRERDLKVAEAEYNAELKQQNAPPPKKPCDCK